MKKVSDEKNKITDLLIKRLNNNHYPNQAKPFLFHLLPQISPLFYKIN
jgi:hypothetical protein